MLVLVLVFGILDYFMLKGRIELPWIIGALAISVGLLAASIAMDFTAQSWAKIHPWRPRMAEAAVRLIQMGPMEKCS